MSKPLPSACTTRTSACGLRDYSPPEAILELRQDVGHLLHTKHDP